MLDAVDEPDKVVAPTTVSSAEQDERILILAPVGVDARLVHTVLTEAGIDARICSDIAELCRAATVGAGAALVSREALTPPALDLLAMTLTRQPAWSDLPVIVLTGGSRSGGDIAELPARALDVLSNASFLERPLRVATLVRAARVALKARQRQYEIREHLEERERAQAERIALLDSQRRFLRDVLSSVTEGRLRLCETEKDLPPVLPLIGESIAGPILLEAETLRILRNNIQTATRAVGFEVEREEDFIMAAHEAAMNAVSHAGGGEATVGVGPSGVVQVRVRDDGTGIDVGRLPQATLERGFSSAGTFGHGFWLILKAVDRLWLLTGPKGTTVVLEQDREPPPPNWML